MSPTRRVRSRSGRRWLALGATAAFAACVVPATARAASSIVVFPEPGSRSASPRSEISFRGGTAAALEGVVVSGSRSGRHSGALKAHADGRGASFVPARPFASGERVRVRVPPSLRVRGGDGRLEEFTTARIVGGFATEGPSGAPRGHGSFATLQSRPDLAPPAIRPLTRAPGRQPGYILVAPKQGTGQGGPMIADDAGTPVWFLPLGRGIRATDFRVQTYRGEQVLTWWQGHARGGSGRGEGVIADASYRIIRRVRAANGLSADLHEFLLTDRDTALVVCYVPVRRNLGAVRGPTDGIAVDGVAQEVELSTGRVLFEWHSLDHVALSDTDQPRPTSSRAPYDYFHINSFNPDPDGGYVISARHVSTVLKVSSAGEVQWRLGGRSTTLKRARGVHFDLQHDAVAHGGGIYTIFDNSARGVRKASRAITVRVDAARHTTTLVAALHHPDHVLAATQGDVQLLGGGSTLVGWGSQGRVSEFAPDGRMVLDLALPHGYDTYRAYRFPWSGRPQTRPRAAALGRGSRTVVYASWNGSTQTASWTVLAGPARDRLGRVAMSPRIGLETPISVATTARYVVVVANDAAGAPLSSSPPVRVSGRG